MSNGTARADAVEADESPLLSVRGLEVEVATAAGWMTVLDGVDLDLQKGEIHGIVGESGSGKSTLALAIAGLLPERSSRISGGEVRFDGVDLVALEQRRMAAIRGCEIAMVFQEPMSSLNPSLTVGTQITESTRHHLGHSKKVARQHAMDLLGRVGIPRPASRLDDYPHTFSGGMRQRIMLAMALACSPRVLLADEPTTALDVTIQAQILDLIRKLSKEEDLGVLFVTHDLGVVSEVCDRTTVLYAGRVLETADVPQVFREPLHPYTAALIRTAHTIDSTEVADAIPGVPPSLAARTGGCQFAPRCEFAEPLCSGDGADDLRHPRPGHVVGCRRHGELQLAGVR